GQCLADRGRIPHAPPPHDLPGRPSGHRHRTVRGELCDRHRPGAAAELRSRSHRVRVSAGGHAGGGRRPRPADDRLRSELPASWTKPITAEALAQVPLLVRELGSGTREAIDSALSEAGGVRVAGEYGSNSALRIAAATAVAPVVLSELA